MRSTPIENLVNYLRDKQSIFVLTGAGISKDSGIPTFRGKDGLWKNYDPLELATAEAFQRNPQLVWEWYHWRQEIVLKARPNPGHIALAEMERIFPSFLIVTQNVDGLHQRAGSNNVQEIHGNIFRVRCIECGKIEDHKLKPDLPRCECGSLFRPDVVWYGEPVRGEVLSKAYEFIMGCDLVMVIGTSAMVQPAASLPIYAKSLKKTLAVINPEPTPLNDLSDFELLDRAAKILPEIVSKINE